MTPLRFVPSLVAAATLFLSPPLRAQSTDIVVDNGTASRTLTETELEALPQDTIHASAHGGPVQTFIGPELGAVLALGGVHLDSLRGKAMAQYVVIEARDQYRAVLAIAELTPDFTTRHVILARLTDGKPIGADYGPWRLIVEGDLRPARWVRQVSAIRLRTAAK